MEEALEGQTPKQTLGDQHSHAAVEISGNPLGEHGAEVLLVCAEFPRVIVHQRADVGQRHLHGGAVFQYNSGGEGRGST